MGNEGLGYRVTENQPHQVHNAGKRVKTILVGTKATYSERESGVAAQRRAPSWPLLYTPCLGVLPWERTAGPDSSSDSRRGSISPPHQYHINTCVKQKWGVL